MPILWIERPERFPANTELLRDFFFFFNSNVVLNQIHAKFYI